MTVLLLALLSVQPPISSPGIAREVLQTTPTLEATRVTFAPGATEPPGNHGYDVVIVPLEDGMTARVDGAAAAWARGVPILISRGAPHAIENRSSHAVSFVEARTKGDAPASGNDTVAIDRATIVRSTVGKYVRATVWRLSGGGSVEWPADTDQLLVVNRSPGADSSAASLDPDMLAVVAERAVRNGSPTDEIVVRVSRVLP